MRTRVMRTRQTLTPENGETFTLQQVVETMWALQQENEESRRQAQEFRANQERLQEKSYIEQQRLGDDVDASRRLMEDTIRANEELQRVNEEFPKTAQARTYPPTRKGMAIGPPTFPSSHNGGTYSSTLHNAENAPFLKNRRP